MPDNTPTIIARIVNIGEEESYGDGRYRRRKIIMALTDQKEPETIVAEFHNEYMMEVEGFSAGDVVDMTYRLGGYRTIGRNENLIIGETMLSEGRVQ